MARTGEPPPGHYVEVWVTVTLGTGKKYQASWNVRSGLAYAVNGALRWAKQDMRDARVEGRSDIRRIDIDAEFVAGDFAQLDGDPVVG